MWRKRPRKGGAMTESEASGAEETAERRSRAGARRYLVAGQWLEAPPLSTGLYVVATPIGNLGDVTLRALEVLAGADLIACEDTRVTRKLLDRYGITGPLTPYHDHNAAAARPKLLARLASGGAIALVSDAGTPLISDPGYKLVREARAALPAARTVDRGAAAPGWTPSGRHPNRQSARHHRAGAGSLGRR